MNRNQLKLGHIYLALSFALMVMTSWACKTETVELSAIETPIQLADPTIFYDQGTYYLYGTSSDSGFLVYQSTDLKSWTGPVGKRNGFALTKGDAYGDKGFWAPQVFKYKNKFYMAYTANEQIAIAQSDSPLGPFTQPQLKAISGQGKQIDPFIFFDSDGKPYLYHVKLRNGNRIYVADMDADLNDVIPGTEKECISAAAGWENTANASWPVAEGPTIFKEGKHYYMLYSANDFRNKDYAVGYATALNPKGPWLKYQNNPIINRQVTGNNGSGHGDLFLDTSGSYKYVMHTHFSDAQVSPRKTAIIKINIARNTDTPNVLSAEGASFQFLQATAPQPAAN